MISQKDGKLENNDGVPSALNTPSPSNDLYWDWNIGPKNFILSATLLPYYLDAELTLFKSIELGGKDRLGRRQGVEIKHEGD